MIYNTYISRQMERFGLVLIMVAFFTACGGGGGNSIAEPSPVEEVSVPNPADDSSTIDGSVAALMESYPIPGLAVAIVSNAEAPVIWAKGYGVQDIGTQMAVTEDTSFWLGSISKSVMGVALMIAQDRGFLELDDNIQTLLMGNDSFAISNPDAQSINYRHLATHTSGIIDSNVYDCIYYVDEGGGEHSLLVDLFDVGITCLDGSPVTLEGFLEAYLNVGGLLYDAANYSQSVPGENFEYSNIASALGGYALEFSTGQNLADYSMQEIFTPLAMSNTSWRYSDLLAENVATPHVVFDGELITIPNYEIATWPDGGLRSSAFDLVTLLSTIMNRGEQGSSGIRILEESTVEEMLEPTVMMPVGTTPIAEEYGVFWITGALEYGNSMRTVVGHEGGDIGAFTLMYFDQEREIGAVILANGDGDDVDYDEVVELLGLLFESAQALTVN